MSQYNFGNLSSPLTGTALIDTHLEPWRDALHSCHSGTSRPSYAVAGMLWIDTTTNPWVIKIFDGSDDITVGQVDTSANTFTVNGSLVTASIKASGASGVIIKNSSGTTVATIGASAGTTSTFAGNVNIAGALSLTGSSNLDVNSNKIINLADPTSAQHAATKAYVDAKSFAEFPKSTVSTTRALAATDALKALWCDTTSGAITLTMPGSHPFSDGDVFMVFNVGTGGFDLTIQLDGSSPVSSIAIKDGNGILLQSDGTILKPLNNSASSFGAAVSKTASTIYQADTDGFLRVRLYDTTNNTEGEIIVYSDATATPSTIIGRQGHWINTGARSVSTYTQSTTLFLPIFKLDYYQVVNSGDASNIDIDFIPLS